MKKVMTSVVLLVVALALVLSLTACGGEKEVVISEFKLKLAEDSDGNTNIEYHVGNEFENSDIVVTAVFSDGEEKVVDSSNQLFEFDTANLKLDADGKFSEAGTFTLKFKFLRYEASLDIEVKESV